MTNTIDAVVVNSSNMHANNNFQQQAVAATVVLHDTQAAQAIKVTYAAIEQLVFEREAWELNAFRTSNEQLYALLQKCYALYKAMSADSEEAKSLRDGLNNYIDKKAFIFSKSTHTLTKIVKCVFGADRRRVSAYSIVLRSALAKGIQALDIAAFIRDSGGVEEVRLEKSPNAMTVKQKAAAVTSAVSEISLGVFSSPQLSSMLDNGKIGTNTLLIGTWQADGSVVIRTVVESDGALNAALASYFTGVKKAAKSTQQETQAANDEVTKADAVQQAVSEAKQAA
jgi:hypothetical protein